MNTTFQATLIALLFAATTTLPLSVKAQGTEVAQETESRIVIDRDVIIEAGIVHKFDRYEVGHRDLGSFMAASRLYGVPVDLVLAMSETISELNKGTPGENIEGSVGWFNFSPQPFLRLMKTHGSKVGFDVSRITGEDGNLQAQSDADRVAILNLRHDPFFATAMMLELAAENRIKLGGLIDDPAEAVIPHLLGPAAAKILLETIEENHLIGIEDIFSENQRRNRALLYVGNMPRSVGEVRDLLVGNVENARPRYAQAERMFIDAEIEIQDPL